VLTLYVKSSRDLQTLKDFSTTNARRSLGSDVRAFAAASVLGEVVLRHTAEEGNPVLYERLTGALDRLSPEGEGDLIARFLAEAWGLVDTLGYRPELSACASCGRGLDEDELGRFDFAAGGIRCSDCAEPTGGPRIGGGARAQLMDLLDGRLPALTRPHAHVKLLGDFVTYHVLDGRPLQSMSFFTDLLPPGHA
jgi:recombinational DNA repair protein (RecF pathway)